MRVFAIAATCAALFAAPALAAGSGNAEQTNQPTAQTGQTTGGTRDNAPGMTTGTVKAPAGSMGRMAPSTGASDSAKGGNANETNKPVGNTGTSSGGPAR